MNTSTRSSKLTLKFATASKRRKLQNLILSYRKAVNFFLRSLWNASGKLDSGTLARLPSANTRLSERYKSNALRQALSIIVSTKKAAKARKGKCSCPVYKGGIPLDAKFIQIQKGLGSFDLVLRISSLKKGEKLVIPTRNTAHLQALLERPGAALRCGGMLSEYSFTTTVELPQEAPALDKGALGVDLGVNKLLSTSQGQFIGEDFKSLRDKILTTLPGSQARKRAYRERDQYIRTKVKELPWDQISTIVLENLQGLKRGKKGNRSRSFRRAVAPWTYPQVIRAIVERAELNRVRVLFISPKNTSRRCPACSVESIKNRRGEEFRCVSCGYEQDADIVGALNILGKALPVMGSVESPMFKKQMRDLLRDTSI